MGYQKKFPEILEKTYKTCKNISTENVPLVEIQTLFSKKRIISLPFLDTVNLKQLNTSDLKQNLDMEIKLSKFNKNFEQLKNILIASKFKAQITKGQIVSKLTSEDDFWNRFHKHTRNDIRKAEKSELIISKIDTKDKLKKFYKLYLKEMQHFGTPQHSYSFFKNSFKILKEDFVGYNCLYKKKVIGSIILFIEGDYVYVSFNVSNSQYKNLRTNNLIP